MPTKNKKSAGKKAGQKSSIFRQLLGAVVGGSLALGLYYSYEFGAPAVTAWLTVPQDQFTVDAGTAAQTDLKDEEARRIAQRARYIVDTFGQEVEVPPPTVEVPANWDLDAIENEEQTEDEGWGGWTDEWPEPPVVPRDEEEEWNAVWDDTWDDEFDALSDLSYEQTPEDVNSWDDTWDDTFWGDVSAEADTPEESMALAYAEEVSTSPPPAPVDSPVQEPEIIEQRSSAPALPSSGVELWIATLVTLGATAGFQRRRLRNFVRGERVC